MHGALLRERLLEKDARLREKDSTLEDLRSERDRLLTLLEEQTVSVKLLTDERVRQEPKPKRRCGDGHPLHRDDQVRPRTGGTAGQIREMKTNFLKAQRVLALVD